MLIPKNSHCNIDGNEGQPPLIDSKQGGTHASTRGGRGPFIDVNHYDGKNLTMLPQKLDFLVNKLASLEATLVRNYDLPTDGGEV